MNPLPLSVPVITRNEAANLDRCLASVAGLAAEIVVVDSGSTDGTREIAERHGARWSHQDWLGYRDQKQVALGLCTRPWVLALDADEEVSPAMREDILTFFRNAGGEQDRLENGVPGQHGKNASRPCDGASFPRKVWFLGRWITHGDWYPDRKLRLARREKARWTGSPEHDKLTVPGPVKKCAGDLHHFSFPDMARYVTKINIFADEYLKRQLADGRRWSLAETLFRPCWRFVRAYFFRRGFLDGFPGLWIAWSTAYQTFVRHSRLYEYERRGGKAAEPAAGNAGKSQDGGGKGGGA
ncbi:MAG: glycosyltransferase family 2 protein [Verrucomicrobiota bacterium]